MRKSLIKDICLAIFPILFMACSSDSLDKHRVEGSAPTLMIHSVTLEDGFTVVMEAELQSIGGSPLLDLGICFNDAEAGEPSLENGESTIVMKDVVTEGRFTIRHGMEPEKNVNIRLFAINSKGAGYSQVESITTPEMNLDQLMVGTFSVSGHQSYFYMEQGVYPNYDVEIKKGPVFMGIPTYTIQGMKIRPGSNEKFFDAQFEIHTNQTDSGVFYSAVFPQQLTGISVTQENVGLRNIMMINGRWLADSDELETDMYCQIDLTRGFEIVFPKGYAFVTADPFTDEIGGNSDDIVDLVLGMITFPENLETDKRAECRISKKY
ncbi:MAG: hypothetical protein ACRC6R_06520 [Bacteroidales bacterium]